MSSPVLALPEALEILGRLYIWQNAAEDILRFLTIADRAIGSAGLRDPGVDRERFRPELHEYTGLGGVGTIKLDAKPDSIAHLHQYFPTWGECHQISDNHKLLALITYGQFYKYGDVAPGSVAANQLKNPSPMAPYWNAMISEIEARGVPQSTFEAFGELVQRHRDGLISHASGHAYQVKHGPAITTMKSMSSGLNSVDFDLMRRICKIMRMPLFDAFQPLMAIQRQSGKNASS